MYKIIDWELKGNTVKFYLGKETEDWGWVNPNYKRKENGEYVRPNWLEPRKDFYGDDWNDRPWQDNAGQVYEQFVYATRTMYFDFDDVVFENTTNNYCKDDFKSGKIPFLAVLRKGYNDENAYYFDFNDIIGAKGVECFYFGDSLEPDSILSDDGHTFVSGEIEQNGEREMNKLIKNNLLSDELEDEEYNLFVESPFNSIDFKVGEDDDEMINFISFLNNFNAKLRERDNMSYDILIRSDGMYNSVIFVSRYEEDYFNDSKIVVKKNQ